MLQSYSTWSKDKAIFASGSPFPMASLHAKPDGGIRSGPEARAMATYIMLSSLNAAGFEAIARRPERIAEVHREFAALDVKIVEQYALVGPYDFLTVVEAPHNLAAFRAAVEQEAHGRTRTDVLPAIDLDL